MRLTKYKCDVCGKETNGEAIGFFVDRHYGEAGIQIVVLEPNSELANKHACGKECLMKAISEAI